MLKTSVANERNRNYQFVVDVDADFDVVVADVDVDVDVVVDVVVEKKKTQSFDKRLLITRMTKSLPRGSESKKPKFKQLQIID